MKNLFFLSTTFTGQRGPDDCGPACLAILLNYAGRSGDAQTLIATHRPAPGGLSLLELRELAATFSLQAKCVKMDFEYLCKLDFPSILHVHNPDGAFHFIVCFCSRSIRGKRQYLTADPATGMSWMTESRLRSIWQSGAALHFEALKFRFQKIRHHSWIKLICSLSEKKMLLISFPAINIAAALLGVALSWLLQRGINQPLAEQKVTLLIPIVILLAIIMVGRNLANHLKQLMLINVNSKLRKKYYHILATKTPGSNFDITGVRRVLSEIQSIQNAVAAIFSVLCSESAVAILLLAGLWYWEPIVGLINTVAIVIQVIYGIKDAILLSAERAILNDHSVLREKELINMSSSDEIDNSLTMHLESERMFDNRARSLASAISRSSLLYECLGSISVILVLTFCLYSVRQGRISYNMLMTEVILSYFIAVLVPRICQVFAVISEGARLNGNFIN